MEEKGQVVPGAGTLGMGLLILALSILFGASMVGYLIVRTRAETWPPPGMPRLPSGLWISTLIIIASSVTMQSALRAARRGGRSGLRSGMLLTTVLGIAFLVSQTLNWTGLVATRLASQPNLYAFTFYMLTGLHALHVVGGLIPLGIVTKRAYAGRYSPDAHGGVKYCQMYWHFLAAVWITMFVLLVVVA